MDFGRSRRASASGVVAIIVTVMVVATVVSGAIVYYSRGGPVPALNTNLPSGNGLSSALSDPQLANLTSSLGGLSDPSTSNLTSALSVLSGNLSSPALANLTSSLGGLTGALSNSTRANFTAALGGQFVAGNSSLLADDFTAAGMTSTFLCAVSPSGAYLAVTDNGTRSAPVASISIATLGSVTEFTPSGACDIAAGPGAITYITFPATSHVSPSPVSGQVYAGVVSLSDGALIPFSGVWQ